MPILFFSVLFLDQPPSLLYCISRKTVDTEYMYYSWCSLLILSNEEKTNDYENFEKGMIYMKILKKGGGRRKRNPCPLRLYHLQRCVIHQFKRHTQKNVWFISLKCIIYISLIKVCGCVIHQFKRHTPKNVWFISLKCITYLWQTCVFH